MTTNTTIRGQPSPDVPDRMTRRDPQERPICNEQDGRHKPTTEGTPTRHRDKPAPRRTPPRTPPPFNPPPSPAAPAVPASSTHPRPAPHTPPRPAAPPSGWGVW